MRSNRSSALSLPLHCRSGNFGAPIRAIRPGRAILRTKNRNLDVFSDHQADLSCKFKRNWSFFKKNLARIVTERPD